MRTTQKLFGGGKVTVPKDIREALSVEDGDLVELDIQKVTDDD